jgi:formate dehydrogenase maturation protein FdhE
MRIRSLQQLTIKWVKEIYTVSESTMRVADSRRSCWICGEPFIVGDGMTVAGTTEGNKLLHSSCYKQQEEEEAENVTPN